MKVLNFSVVFFLCLGVISCSEDDFKPENSERLITNAETENRSNEWDITGQLHNDFLDFFITRDDFENSAFRSNLLEITREFYSINNLPYNGNEINATFDVFQEMENDGVDVGIVLDNQSSTGCDYIPTLCDLFPFNPFPIPDFNFITSGNNTDKVLDFIERTKELENDVLKNDSFSEEQKAVLLESYAVSRYSHQYWHNQEVLGNESQWVDSIREIDVIEQACSVCKADFVGAVTGAFTGPGALIGAGAASAAQAYANWLFGE
ncbi:MULTISPECIES: hypothetical protein [Cyclobacterium]|uniref:hypothetical protein n=1 Tax=Cyclobacterium TaxID=68288 RepID=UPI001390C998|nr:MULTISPECIES: hypothetical protein [Cyclobacterium]